MKRFVAMLLVLVTLLGSTASLSGCSPENEQSLMVGQWLMMVNDTFGMESYVQEEPYFANVDSKNPYYETVQIATEWNVIQTDENIDVNKIVIWKEALVTLVNAGNFIPVDSTEDEKIEHAIKTLDTSIRKYWMNREIKYEEAIVLLGKAQEIWANKTYTENIERIEYKDHVKDLTQTVSNYSIQNGVIELSKEDAESIAVGDIYVLPSKDNPYEYTYYRAEEINTVDDVTYINNASEELEIEDIMQEVQLQGTIIPTSENTLIYDGNGQLISDSNIEAETQNNTSSNSYEVTPLVATETPSITTCASGKITHSFRVDGYKVGLSYKLDGDLDLSVSVETPNLLSDDDNGELKGNLSAGISNLKVSHDFDFGWTGLKSAMLKVDYKTETSVGMSYSAKPIDAVAAPSYSNGNGKFLTNFKRAVLKDRDGLGAKTIASKKTIKVCSLNVYSVGVAKVCLDVNVQLAADGSFTVTVTESGSKGVEYKNGNLRFIKKSNKSAEAELKGNLELTIGFGPGLYVVGLKKQLVGLEVRGGVGASASLKWHLADSESHLIEELSFTDTQAEVCELAAGVDIDADAAAIKAIAEQQGGIYSAEAGTMVKLHVDTCFDVSLYAILKVGLTDSSYAAKFVGGKVKLSVSVFDSKNAKFFNMHVDNWNWSEAFDSIKWGSTASGDNCTLEYVPFDSAEEKTEDAQEEAVENQDIVNGDFIVLSEIRADVEIGNKYCINITQIPRGYELSDIGFKSSNDKIASVNSEGVITGVAEGSTTITVGTGDGKYKAVVAVSVTSEDKVQFEGLEV